MINRAQPQRRHDRVEAVCPPWCAYLLWFVTALLKPGRAGTKSSRPPGAPVRLTKVDGPTPPSPAWRDKRGTLGPSQLLLRLSFGGRGCQRRGDSVANQPPNSGPVIMIFQRWPEPPFVRGYQPPTRGASWPARPPSEASRQSCGRLCNPSSSGSASPSGFEARSDSKEGDNCLLVLPSSLSGSRAGRFVLPTGVHAQIRPDCERRPVCHQSLLDSHLAQERSAQSIYPKA